MIEYSDWQGVYRAVVGDRVYLSGIDWHGVLSLWCCGRVYLSGVEWQGVLFVVLVVVW